MKLDDLVSFRIGRNHRVAYGVLVAVQAWAGTCTVKRDGRCYTRSLKRVKPASVGRREEAKKAGVRMRRGKTP
jgi:hypothetical protein